MIDKLDLRVPATTRFTIEFDRWRRDQQNGRRNPFQPSRDYRSVADLREFGCDAILHSGCKRRRSGPSKLEFLHSGTLTYADIVHHIQRIFDVDATGLEIMRIDLAVDVEGFPVEWFRDRLRGKRKQRIAHEYGNFQYGQLGKGNIETLYLGKRPDFFRVYDKKAQLRQRFADSERKNNSSKALLTPDGILTRIERQISGARIPPALATAGDLKHAAEFNPFSQLELLGDGIPEPSIDDYKPAIYLQGIGLRHLIVRLGMHSTFIRLKKSCNGNIRRLLRQLRDFLPAEDPSRAGQEPMTIGRVFEIHQNSVSKQLQNCK